MSYITPHTGYLFLALFGGAMVLLTSIFAKRRDTTKQFLIANRKIGWLQGSLSIAASWIWAPALFVSVQAAYEKGIAGLFWFTIPNIVALGLFALFAPRIRKQLPKGYTLPEYIKERLGNAKLHKIYLIPYLFYQVMAVTVQLFAGGNLITLLTGIPIIKAMLLLAAIGLAYTLISGLKASVITDNIQMFLILLIGGIIIWATQFDAGGWTTITAGMHGLAQAKLFDPHIAFSYGIVTSIGLIAGAINDQQYWQRSFAIKRQQLRKAFIVGALIFGLVPLGLSLLGFIAANPATNITMPTGTDPSLIGVQTVAHYLSPGALLLFTIMLMAGISSTLDSGLSAASSLWVTDIARKKTIAQARYAMLGITSLGFLIALIAIYVPGFGLQELWWLFNTIAACTAIPTILALYWKRLTAKGAYRGIITAFALGIPFFIYGNVIGSAGWIVGSTLGIMLVSSGFCLLYKKGKDIRTMTTAKAT